MRARYYDPEIGRFISEDPAGDGVNWYVYCGNNPVNLIDVTGTIKAPYLFLGIMSVLMIALGAYYLSPILIGIGVAALALDFVLSYLDLKTPAENEGGNYRKRNRQEGGEDVDYYWIPQKKGSLFEKAGWSMASHNIETGLYLFLALHE